MPNEKNRPKRVKIVNLRGDRHRAGRELLEFNFCRFRFPILTLRTPMRPGFNGGYEV